MTPATVFLSYSHKDEKEKDALLSHLRVLEHAGLSIDLWNDDRIGAGGDWEREINEAMERASVAILLTSHNFLTSPFILKKEVRPLLERRADEGLTVFPIIAKACAWKRVPWLTKMNLRPKNGTPVWQGEALDLDEKLAAITEEVADIVDKKEAERQEAIRCHLNDAQGARENGDYSEAYRFLDAILGDKGLDPGNEEAGRLRNAVEREDQLSTLHKSLARARSPARIVEISGQILKLAPDDKEVQTAHEQARHQLEIDECRKDAEAAFEKGDYEGAIASWKRLLALELADKEAEEAKAELERTYNQGITRLTKTLKEREEETESLKGTVQAREE
jgi:tetratricopeptide (TPR) repeat protein